MNGRTWFPVSSGLLTREHYRHIGAALWVFLWFIHHQYKPKHGEPDTGAVNGGDRVTCEQIGADLGIPAETCRKHVLTLEREQYVRSQSIPGLGKRYFVTNPIRWTLGATKNGDTTEGGATKNGRGVSPKMVGGVTKFGGANKEQRTKELQRTKPRVRGFDASQVLLPPWLPQDAWLEFVEHRNNPKSPLTELAVKKNLKLLENLRRQGHDPRAVIDQSIANGWKGLFEVKGNRAGSNGNNVGHEGYKPLSPNHVPPSERLRREREQDAREFERSAAKDVQ